MKHALVIGASRGLGLSLVSHLADRNWAISFGARTASRVARTREQLQQRGVQTHAGYVDVCSSESVDEFFRQANDALGPIGYVVNCAARYGPFGSLSTLSQADWAETIEINLVGTFNFLRAAARYLQPNGGSAVVLSGGGATQPMPTVSAYAASKAGVVRLVETFAEEVAPYNIYANCLAPGLLRTDMLDEVLSEPIGIVDPIFRERMVQAHAAGEDNTQVAVEAIEFLLLQASSDLTGSLLSAVWDPWRSEDLWLSCLSVQENFKLRRVSP